MRAGIRPIAAILPALVLVAASASGAPEATPSGIPAPVVRTLDNGLRVAVFPIHRFALAEAQLMVPGGQTSEPAGAPGVALLTARMLTRGTTSRDEQQFADDAHRLGGTILSSASRDYATLGGAFLAADLGPGLELISDAAINPVFDETALRTVRLDAIRGAQQLRSDPGALADESLWALLFEGHPYSRPPIGTDSSLAGMTRDQIRAFHSDHYRPDGALLVIAGDVVPDTAFALAREWFGRWAGHAAAPPAAKPVTPPARSRVRVIDVPDAPFSLVKLGVMMPGRRSDDDVPFTLALTEFGGGAFSRLQSPRVTRRVGVTSGILDLKDGGLYSFGAPASTDSVATVVDLLRGECREFVRAPVSGVDLPSVRRGSLGGFVSPLETLSGLIAQWGGMVFIGQPADALPRTVSRLSSVSADEIHGAVQRWLDPGRLAIVAVGPASQLEKQLARFGPVEIVHPPAPASLAAAGADTTAVTPDNLARGKQIVAAAIAAHGGLDSLRAIHDSVIDMKIAMGPANLATAGRLRQMRKEPGRMVSITDFRDFQSRQVLNGDRAWSVTGATLLDADSLETAGLKASYSSDLPHLLLALVEPGTRVVARGADKIMRRDADVVEVRLASGQFRRYYFDAGTHLLGGIDVFEGLPGTGHSSRRFYAGYQAVQGIQWPFREERQVEGQQAMRIEITTVQLNPGVADKEFEKPVGPAH